MNADAEHRLDAHVAENPVELGTGVVRATEQGVHLSQPDFVHAVEPVDRPRRRFSRMSSSASSTVLDGDGFQLLTGEDHVNLHPVTVFAGGHGFTGETLGVVELALQEGHPDLPDEGAPHEERLPEPRARRKLRRDCPWLRPRPLSRRGRRHAGSKPAPSAPASARAGQLDELRGDAQALVRVPTAGEVVAMPLLEDLPARLGIADPPSHLQPLVADVLHAGGSATSSEAPRRTTRAPWPVTRVDVGQVAEGVVEGADHHRIAPPIRRDPYRHLGGQLHRPEGFGYCDGPAVDLPGLGNGAPLDGELSEVEEQVVPAVTVGDR